MWWDGGGTRNWSTRLYRDWNLRAWELKPQLWTYGTRPALEIFWGKERIEEECIRKGGGRDNSERSSVCKPSRNVSTKRLHCKAWLRPMRKWEWVRQKPRGRIEWKNAFVHWALIFHRHSKGDRSAGQGEGQEKGNSVFCILKSHENVSWSRLSAPSGGNLESLGLRL